MQNMNKSLSGLPPISRYNEGVVHICENVANDGYAKPPPPSYYPFKRLENTFEGDSSASFWVSPFHELINVEFPGQNEIRRHISTNTNENNNKKMVKNLFRSS